MWGFGIYLVHLTDYLRGRRNKMHCNQCGRVFKDERELDSHMRTDHPPSM